MLMKNPIFLSFIASSILAGCQDSTQSSSESNNQIDQVAEHKVTVAKWVGKYHGTTPCMGCNTRCEECPGMVVDLVLNQNKTYTLKRESLSGNDQQEIYTGQFHFRNTDHSKIELMQVKVRNLMSVDLDQQILEILQDQTSHLYPSEGDFILEKKG